MADEKHTSSPTPQRASLIAILSLLTACRMGVAIVDISQAFLQAGAVAMKDRVVISTPEFIEMPWKNKVSKPVGWKRQRNTVC